MPWFAIRSVYHFGRKRDGSNIFEERIVAFQSESADRALDKAQIESEEYLNVAELLDVHPDRVAYEQDGEALIDGYELWSELSESSKGLVDFYADRYLRGDYHPE